jgi:hypothetical protein
MSLSSSTIRDERMNVLKKCFRFVVLVSLALFAGCTIRPYMVYTPSEYDASARRALDSTRVKVLIVPEWVGADSSRLFADFTIFFQSKGIDMQDYQIMGQATTCLELGVDFRGNTVGASFTREQAIEALRGEAARRGASMILVKFRERQFKTPAFGFGIYRGYMGESEMSASYVDAVLLAHRD